MTKDERDAAVMLVAGDPESRKVMVGTGGCRKTRLAGRGKGKLGGYRLISLSARDGRVFLLTVFSKGERGNLSHAERNALAKLATSLT